MEEDRRLTGQLLKYWDNLRGDKVFPRREDVSIADLQDVWEHCFLISVAGKAIDKGVKYEYLGEKLVKAYGDGIAPGDAGLIIESQNPDVLKKVNKVLDSKAPLVDEDEFTNSDDVVIKYREIMLPLGSSKSSVECILGGMRWKPYKA